MAKKRMEQSVDPAGVGTPSDGGGNGHNTFIYFLLFNMALLSFYCMESINE